MKISSLKIQNVLVVTLAAIALLHCSKTTNIKDDSNPRVRLCINKIDAEDVDKKTASHIVIKLHKKLQSIKGKNIILLREKEGISKSANRQLTGRISKLGNKLFISIKVIEGEKGSLLFNKSITIKRKDLDSVLDDIAEDISDSEDIW